MSAAVVLEDLHHQGRVVGDDERIPPIQRVNALRMGRPTLTTISATFSDAGVSQSPVEWATYPSLRWHRPLATMAPASRGRPLVSLQPHCSISAAARLPIFLSATSRP